ncbi:MAG: hypothetical protein Q9P14_15825 [candidate division KSB1 bacterium]|nr:hypothetical protein [candidate division KSB1 bacterium]
MEIKIPCHSEVFSFSLHSKPAQKIKTKGHKTENVYDAMALSAYADFCKEFIRQSGLENSVKDLIKLKEENGKKSLSLNLTKEWLAEALSEFAKMEEGNLDLKDITMEYVELLTDVSTEFSSIDIGFFSFSNGGFDFDISFD